MSLPQGVIKLDTVRILNRISSMQPWQRALVFVYVNWAPSCKRIESYVDQLGSGVGEFSPSTDLLFFKVDADEEPELVTKWNITAYPTFLWFNSQQFLGDFVGANRIRLDKVVRQLDSDTREERDQ